LGLEEGRKGRPFHLVVTFVQHVAMVELQVLHFLHLFQLPFIQSGLLDDFLVLKEVQLVFFISLELGEFFLFRLHEDLLKYQLVLNLPLIGKEGCFRLRSGPL